MQRHLQQVCLICEKTMGSEILDYLRIKGRTAGTISRY